MTPDQCEKYTYWTDGESVWILESWCEFPTATLRKVDSDIRLGGAMCSLNLKDFKPIEMIERPKPAPGEK